MAATASASSFQVVLPGDVVRTLPATSSIRLGPGVVQAGGTPSASTSKILDITATRSGIVGALQLPGRNGAESTESSWVEASSKRYVPALGEPVIGVIVARHAEGYRVDIGSAQMAALDALAFEDATKRNKPNLKVGTVVYGRLSLALPFCEPEMECLDPKTGKAQGFGELTGGMLIRDLGLDRCRAYLSPNHPVLTSLSSKFPFEMAIGVNGRIWVKANDVQHTIAAIQAIKAIRGKSPRPVYRSGSVKSAQDKVAVAPRYTARRLLKAALTAPKAENGASVRPTLAAKLQDAHLTAQKAAKPSCGVRDMTAAAGGSGRVLRIPPMRFSPSERRKT